jgi:hypothetical protein
MERGGGARSAPRAPGTATKKGCAAMVESGRKPETAERAFWSWIAFWLQFLILAVCIVLGAFTASGDAQPGDYAVGIILILSAAGLGFLRLQQSFDQPPAKLGDFLLVDNVAGLAVVVPSFVIVGLAGLFIARAWPGGSLHDAGIALFVFSGAIVFFDVIRVVERAS